MLSGRRVVLTRAAGQGAAFAALLRAKGAEVIEYPVIEIAEPESWAPVDAAIARLGEYEWVVFTSANAVRAFFGRAGGQRFGGKIVVVGPATRAAVEELGYPVAAMAREFIGEGIVEALAREGVESKRILLPRAAVARDVVPDGLRALGAKVDVVDVYRNVLPRVAGAWPDRVDWVTFTSASTVKNLLALADRARLAGVRLASIGPQTSEALRKHGLDVTVEAAEASTEALAAAMEAYEHPAG
jgi:uroporphyrinogen-III synthase